MFLLRIVSTLMALIICCNASAASGKSRDDLDIPSAKSKLAARSPIINAAMAGNRIVAVGQRGHIVYSDDQGGTWTQAESPVSSDLVAVHFSDAMHGWAVGHSGVILSSIDGGISWVKQLDGRSLGKSLADYYQNKVEDSRKSLAPILEEVQRIKKEGPERPFLDVWFADNKVGYVVGAFNLIMRTEDGGKSWTPLMERVDNPQFSHLYSIRPFDKTLYITGEQGLVLRQNIETGRFEKVELPYKGTFFGSASANGYIMVYGLEGNAFGSVDGGINWNSVKTGTTSTITGVTKLAKGPTVLVTQSGEVCISKDDNGPFAAMTVPVSSMSYFGILRVSDTKIVLYGSRGLSVTSLN